ncbi:MAG: 4Fe-4S binding protein [bacterium]|nr:4Fe-4S binding protein [bacterium]MDT8395008.1 4Fe-4S binding protein [bacterium]
MKRETQSAYPVQLDTTNPAQGRMAGFAPAFLKSGWWWTSVRLLALAAMALVAAAAWGRRSIPGVEVPDPLMYTNLGNLLFWVFWLMGLVLLAPLAGRAWCGFCPLGAVNEVVARYGLGRPFPALFRNQHLKAGVLVATVFLMGLTRIHHYPSLTAWYLAGWAGSAVLIGSVFAGRSLCSYLCPIGGMLGLYGRVAPVTVGVREESVCRSCEGRECVRGAAQWLRGRFGRLNTLLRLRRYPCPVNLKVWDMGGSDRCLGCFNCMRACPRDNVAVYPRAPVASLWRETYPRFSDTVMVSVLMGFVILAFSRFWPSSEMVLSAPVRWLAPVLGPAARPAFLLWLVLVLPLLSFLLAAAVTRWGHSRIQVQDSPPERLPQQKNSGNGFPFRVWLANADPEERKHEEERVLETDTVRGLSATYAGVVIPLLLASHAVLALVKINAKAAYLPLAVADPAGMASYAAVFELGILPAPDLLLPVASLRAVALAVMAAGTVTSLVVYRKMVAQRGLGSWPSLIPMILLGIVVFGGLVKWLF